MMGEMNSIFSKRSEANKTNSDLQMRRIKRSGSKSSSVNRILYLQRTIGNQAVSRLIRSKALQAKLRIGQPGDVYEQEADRVADEVMRMPEPGVQRQVEPEEEEEEILQTKPLVDQITPLVQRQVEEEEMLQAKNREDSTSEVTNDLESQIDAIKGGGRPLEESERGYFEPRFGVDFSNVRIHTDSNAAQLSRELNAQAFTYGTNIVFNRGEFNPAHKEGQRIIAHELVHVIQQNSVHPETAGSKSHPIHMQPSRQNLIQRIIPVPTVSPPECGSMSDARELLTQAYQVLESEEIDNDQYETLLSSISELESALENFEDTCRSSERPSSTVAPGGSVGMSLTVADRSGALAAIVAIVGFLAAIVTGSQLGSLDPEQQERLRQHLQRGVDRVREAIRNLRREDTETLTDFHVEPTINEATPEEIAEDIIPEDEPPDRDRCLVIPQGPRGGNNEHDALAAHITGQPVEYLVISPSGRSWQFDGMDETNTLYEVKTRHDFIRVIDIIDSASQLTDRQIQVISQWIPDLHDDIEEESIIAYECGHPFHVATNNRNILQALRLILNDILPADQIEFEPFSFNE